MTAHDAIRQWFREDAANRYLNPADQQEEIIARLRQLGFDEAGIEGLRVRIGSAWMIWLGWAMLVLGLLGPQPLVSAPDRAFIVSLATIGLLIAWSGERRINYDRREAKALRLEEAEQDRRGI